MVRGTTLTDKRLLIDAMKNDAIFMQNNQREVSRDSSEDNFISLVKRTGRDRIYVIPCYIRTLDRETFRHHYALSATINLRLIF